MTRNSAGHTKGVVARVDLEVLSCGSAGLELADIDRYGLSDIERYSTTLGASRSAQTPIFYSV